VHATPSSQLAGHGIEAESGSQVSWFSGSTMPLPHVAEQSSSFPALQVGGQQPSPFWHVSMSSRLHADEQLSWLPLKRPRRHKAILLQAA
jgi:hypothetical protein